MDYRQAKNAPSHLQHETQCKLARYGVSYAKDSGLGNITRDNVRCVFFLFYDIFGVI